MLKTKVNPARVCRGVPCREMQSSLSKLGYGKMFDGEKPQYVHRLSWEVTVGPIPDGIDICHHCDNPSCIEPAHLWDGTAKQNTADMIAKGRHLAGRERGAAKRRGAPAPWVRGARHPLATISYETAVRAKMANVVPRDPELGISAWAQRLGMSPSLFSGIRRGDNWGWIGTEDIETRKALDAQFDRSPSAMKVEVPKPPPREKPVNPYARRGKFKDYPVGPLRLRDALGKGK
jgi:hypothetical protein